MTLTLQTLSNAPQRDAPEPSGNFRHVSFGFLEIELANPQPEQNKEYSERVDLPVRLRPVCAFEPEAHHSGQHNNDSDNLLYFHAATIAQISFFGIPKVLQYLDGLIHCSRKGTAAPQW
jgi:hypothetical protein